MPINVDELYEMLRISGYDKKKTTELVFGFKFGFKLNYQGPLQRRNYSKNIPFTIGDKIEIWNKIMKEVAANRYAGPFHQVPFENFIQSPIGLVPKDGGKKTRFIFHLSYNFSDFKSVNFYTPAEDCLVKYNDLDHAIRQSLWLIQSSSHGRVIIWYGKTDLQSAFRILGTHPEVWWMMVMKAENPKTSETSFFIDKCLPFGHSMSCVLFQKFSDALAHIQ